MTVVPRSSLGMFLGIWSCCLLAGALAVAGVLLLDPEVLVAMIDSPASDEVCGPITGQRVVVQRLTAGLPDLTRIQVFTATYRREDHDGLTFKLFALDEDGGPAALPAREVDIPPERIEDNAWVDVVFEPLRDSQDRSYALVITAPEAEPDRAVTVYYSARNDYPGAALLVDGVRMDGNLRLRAAAGVSPFQLVRRLPLRFAENRPGWFGSPRLYVSSFGLLFLFVGALPAAFAVRALRSRSSP